MGKKQASLEFSSLKAKAGELFRLTGCIFFLPEHCELLRIIQNFFFHVVHA